MWGQRIKFDMFSGGVLQPRMDKNMSQVDKKATPEEIFQQMPSDKRRES